MSETKETISHKKYVSETLDRLLVKFPSLSMSVTHHDPESGKELIEFLESPLVIKEFKTGAPSWMSKPMTTLTVFFAGDPNNQLYLNTSSIFDCHGDLFQEWSKSISNHFETNIKETL